METSLVLIVEVSKTVNLYADRQVLITRYCAVGHGTDCVFQGAENSASNGPGYSIGYEIGAIPMLEGD
jgi:hypothetical protein